MSPADPRRRSRAEKAIALAALGAVSAGSALVVAVVILVLMVPSAAAAGSLTVRMDRALTQSTETPGITVTGNAITGLVESETLRIHILGPANMSQLSQPDPALPEVASFTVTAESLPSAARPAASVLHLPLSLAGVPAAPGAYRVEVEILSGDTLIATGETWMGRVAARTNPLDLAFVWRAALGIHKGPNGSFFDTALEQACARGTGAQPSNDVGAQPSMESAGPAASESVAQPASVADAGSLTALLALPGEFPEWHFTLGIEPVLLTQLRDMADGYVGVVGASAGAGGPAQIDAGDARAGNAAAVLAGFSALATEDTVEVAVGPYSGPDLGWLATQQGWRDGLQQIQLGKQEIVHTLSLGMPPSGAWSPGLDLSTGSLGDYGRASIDHVLVDAAVAGDLAEPVEKGAVAVRAQDDQNDRVTLLFCDSDLRALMADPWDPAALFAGIAAILATGSGDALVLSPASDFVLPPGPYLDAIAEELGKDAWIRTQTMSEMLRAHPAGTRPVLLDRDPAPLSGYIAQTISSAVQSAHAAVDDLALVADSASAPLEEARLSLYLSESRWWSRPGVSPEEASAGLGYAVRAETAAKGELDKVGLGGARGELILGHEGQVKVVAQNDAGYPVTVRLRLSGESLEFPQGEVVQVRLEPGGNQITVPVVGRSPSTRLTAALLAGTAVLDASTTTLRFVTFADMLPWVTLAVVVIAVIALVLIYLRSRKPRRRA